MLYKILTLCLLPFLFSCQSVSQKSYEGEGGLVVDKKALSAGVLKIHLPENHPSSMSIRAPNNDWYIVQDSSSSVVYISQDKFDNSDLIEFDINTLEGVIWRAGTKTTEKVFNQEGEYLIYLANNLETEPENTFSMRTIVDYKKRY